METDLRIDSIFTQLKGKNIALLSDISYNRDLIIINYIFDGLTKGETVCIVTFTNSSDRIIEILTSFNDESVNLINEAIMNEKLLIIDAYSFRSTANTEEIPGVIHLKSANNLTEISIHMNIISKQQTNLRIVVWPLSVLALYVSTNQLVNFLQTQIARISQRQQTNLYVIDRDVLDDHALASVESLLDGVLETKVETTESLELNELFRVKFIRGEYKPELSSWLVIG